MGLTILKIILIFIFLVGVNIADPNEDFLKYCPACDCSDYIDIVGEVF